jgi:hypothetical protein
MVTPSSIYNQEIYWCTIFAHTLNHHQDSKIYLDLGLNIA